jgi:hypothetical protein
MGFLMPKVPAMPAIPEPKPLPKPPKMEDPVRKEEVKDKIALIKKNKKGKSSTILTTADGLLDNELTTKKKLLGG